MSGRTPSSLDDRYDPRREDQLDHYEPGLEDPLDRYDLDPVDQEDSTEHYSPYREERCDRHDHHGTGHKDREERRYRHSFGRRLRQMMDDLRDTMRDIVSSVRLSRRHPMLLTRLSQRRSESRAADDSMMRTMREFQRLTPPGFSGETDSQRAEEWLLRITQMLDAVGIYDDGQRVSLASFYLQGPAHHWWTVARQFAGDTWEGFKEVFLHQYMPDLAMNRLRRQFEKLTQGTSTVTRYAEQFVNLSRFAPDLVVDEERRCRRFEAGLHPGIRNRVVVLRHYVFADLLESVRAVEGDWEVAQTKCGSRKTKGARTSGDNHQSTRQKSSSPESGPDALRRSGSVGSSSRGPRRFVDRSSTKCHLCEQSGHMVSQCPKLTQARVSISGSRPHQLKTGGSRPSGQGSAVCFRCRQLGHVIRDCPVLVDASHVASTGPSSTQQSCQAQTDQDSQFAQPQTQISRGGGREDGSGRGKMTAMVAADEPGTLGTHQETPVRPFELRGTVLLFGTLVRALFDTCASHSFISQALVDTLGLRVERLDYPLLVKNPMGGQTRLQYVCPSCIVYLEEHRLMCNFIVLNMTYFDVIFGMDWLVSHNARIDCGDRRIILQGEDGDFVHFVGDRGDKDLDTHFGMHSRNEAPRLYYRDAQDYYHSLDGS